MRVTIFLVLAALLLTGVARARAPEYDEAYSIFLTAGDARPAWPGGVFTAGSVRGFYAGQASPGRISRGLKVGDVHPPLYFWLLEFWRRGFGPSWFAARMLSVVLSVGALGLVAWLAEAAGIAVLPALALTLLSYGFAYTGVVARGFALAQVLNLLGGALVFQAARDGRRGWALAGGLALGAASFANYLAVFIGIAWGFWLCLARARWRLLLPVALGGVGFLPLDAGYFLAQRGGRAAQFAPFSLGHALALLARDVGAAVFGGLPLYAGRAGGEVTVALLLLFLACLGCVIRRRHPQAGVLALCALAPPCGLMGLSIVFHNTPIEIRYLAFGLPFLALLLAASLPRGLLVLVLGVQAGAVAGLALAPATEQPQALAAREARAMGLGDALILLPRGNDGVGVPGPFIAALPDTARLEVLRPGQRPALGGEAKIILADVGVDAASRAGSAELLAYLQADKCLTAAPATRLTRVFLDRCAQQQP